jgi:membrane protein
VTGILLLIAISRGLRIYLYYFPTYNSTYGSLGAVIVLLLFFYLSGVAVLSGAALNAVVQAFHVRGTAGHAPPEGGVVQRAS